MEAHEHLRARFDAIDARALTAMKERQEEENQQLEFKQITTSGVLSEDDKNNLREAISGFANAIGGIVIWGVTTKDRQGRDTDRFFDYRPILNPDAAEERLRELSQESTDPPVSGVTHARVAVPGGFVIKTLVPESEEGPHRTRPRCGNYFRRHADQFHAMQHFEVAEMFGRRARPKLHLSISEPVYYSGRVFSHQIPEYPVKFDLSVINTGRGVARFAALQLYLPPDDTIRLIVPQAGGLDAWPRRPRRSGRTVPHIFAADSHTVVFTDETVDVTSLSIQARPAHSDPPVPRFTYRLLAEGVTPITGEHTFDAVAAYERVVRVQHPLAYS